MIADQRELCQPFQDGHLLRDDHWAGVGKQVQLGDAGVVVNRGPVAESKLAALGPQAWERIL